MVLEHFPVKSIKDISLSSGFFGGLFGGGPWQAKLVTVEGEDRSRWTTSSTGSCGPSGKTTGSTTRSTAPASAAPTCSPSPLPPATLERLLDGGAREYVNHPRGASFADGRLRVSSIYDWFQADFGGNAKGVLEHLKKHAKPALRKRLEGHGGRLDFHYDWSLNAAGR